MAHRPQRAPLMTADRLRAIIEKIPMRDHTTTDPVTATNTSNDNPNTFTGIQLTPVTAIDDTTAAESALATSSSTMRPHSSVAVNEIDATDDLQITYSSGRPASQASIANNSNGRQGRPSTDSGDPIVSTAATPHDNYAAANTHTSHVVNGNNAIANTQTVSTSTTIVPLNPNSAAPTSYPVPVTTNYSNAESQPYDYQIFNGYNYWNSYNIWPRRFPMAPIGPSTIHAPVYVRERCVGPCGRLFETSSDSMESRCRHCRNLPRPEGVIGQPTVGLQMQDDVSFADQDRQISFMDDGKDDVAEYEGRVCLRGGGGEEEEEEEEEEEDDEMKARIEIVMGKTNENADDGYDGDDDKDENAVNDDNYPESDSDWDESEDHIETPSGIRNCEAKEQEERSPFGDQYAISENDFASDSTLVEEKSQEYRLSWRTRHRFRPLGSESDPDNAQDLGLAQWANATQEQELRLDRLIEWICERDAELERNRLRYEQEDFEEHESEHSAPTTTFSPINSIVQTSNIVPVSRTLRQAYSPEEDSNFEEEEHEQALYVPPPGQMPLGPYIAVLSESSRQSSHHNHSNAGSEELTQEERRELEAHLAAMGDGSEHGSEVDDDELEEAQDEGHESDEGAEDGFGSNSSWGGATLLGYRSDLECRFSDEWESEGGRLPLSMDVFLVI